MIYDLYIKLKQLKISVRDIDGRLDIQAAKGVLTKELLEEIKSHKDELISFLKSYKKKKAVYNPIPEAAVQPDYPLSSAQRRLWILSQLEGAGIAYHIPGIYIFEGNLDRVALEGALQKLIARHEILRTVFREDGAGTVRQVILSPQDANGVIAFHDLREEKRDGMLSALTDAAFREPFDLTEGPLLRMGLYRLEDRKWVFAYVMHHIISDGWSMAILIKELLLFYNAFTKGNELLLEPLPIQYKDYAVWQQEQLGSASFGEHKAYWLEQLKGELPVLEFPLDKTRPAIKTYNGGAVNKWLDPALGKAIRSLSQELGGTLFMGLLATVNALLYKYTGQEDIIIGSPIAGRDHADLEGQIGFYVNILPLRVKFNAEESFRELLGQVKQTTLHAYGRQTYPFDELINELQWQNDNTRRTLFDVFIDLHEQRTDTLAKDQLGDLQASAQNAGEQMISKFDLTFMFTETDEGLNLSLEYNSDLFRRETVERMFAHFESLLGTIVKYPSQPVERLDYLEIDERNSLLYSFNNAPADGLPYISWVSLFERQVNTAPDSIAVIFGEKRLTYRALDEKANQLANYLRETCAIGTNDLVGIMLDRSEKMIIAILGILKAGAAYVPIDPEYPKDRKAYIIKDTGIKTLIAQTDYIFDLEYYDGGIFAIDIQLDSIESSGDRANAVYQPGDLAYVIYTSGSTGLPKGCAITHGNLSNYIQWANSYYFSGTDKPVFGLFTSLSFDLTVTSIFCPLAKGGWLSVFGQQEDLPGILSRSFAGENGINSVKLTPSHINILRHYDIKSSAIQAAIVGGEQVAPDHVHILKGINPVMVVYNEYGPTEATVGCIVHVLEENEPILIGKPISGAHIYILDAKRALCPIGIVGEIYIGGTGVAKGYLNKDELTAEKFIADPFRDGERIYKTEDLGKWLPDGNIAFVGRKGDQVKVRGYRIELGEIETAIQGHPDIASAVVITRPGRTGEMELVAYLVGKETLHTTDIRKYLVQCLPAYMLPSHFVQLDELPLTVNGKVDKKQLPDHIGLSMSTGITYVAARNETEQKLVGIWEKVLGRTEIGIRDGFFEVGGDSMKILMVLSELKKALNLQMTIADIYKCNTIEDIADYAFTHGNEIKQKNREAEKKHAKARADINELKERILASGGILHPENIEDIYPMSDIEKGMVFESLVNAGLGVYHDQMFDKRVFDNFDIDRFRSALTLLVEKHTILRTGFNVSDYETEVQIVYREIDISVPYKDISSMSRIGQERELRDYFQSELQNPFKVTEAPLWRMSVFNLGKDEIVFIFQCHHAIIDGWSDALFTTELNNLYLKLGTAPSYRPDPLQSSYKDFIIQHEIDKKDEGIRGFWQEELSGYTRLDLFTEEDEEEMVKSLRFLDAPSVRKLEKTAASLNTTVKIISLSVYLYMLKILNHSTDIVSGLVVNTRPNCPDSDKILGCFLNTIPLRLIIEGEEKCGDLVKRVHNKLLALKDKETLSILEIARLHHTQSEPGSPFFDVLFNYIDFHVYDTLIEDDSPIDNDEFFVAGSVRGNTFLDFSIDRTGGHFRVNFCRTRKLKSGFSAEKIIDLYVGILKYIMDFPDQAINAFDCIQSAERDTILKVFNDTAVTYPTDKTITALFEEQADRHPDRVALVFAGAELTFRELNERSNRLAGYLHAQYGIKADDLVAVRLDRSAGMIIAILGILKAGGAYVPIDPAYPADRIAYMLEDSQCKAVIDDEELARFGKEENSYSSQNRAPVNKSTDLAYVIYTSGSTGRPKGCMLEHRGIINRIKWMWEQYDFRQDDIILQKTTFTFDVSVWELFLPLCFGAKMVLCQTEDIGSPQRILSLIETQQVTCLHFVPGMLSAFIASLFELGDIRERLASLRRVITSGEALLLGTVKEWYATVDIPIHNLYGPTEASVDVTYYPTSPQDRMIPIGRPIWNTQMFIVNDTAQLAPIGIAGEICIGGDGLARGYLNKPGLTAEKFVPNPFRKGDRMYRTGDLGRWLPDGNIAFIGRADDQVKIRGFRIELGEIENVLQRHPLVDSAVVVARSVMGAGEDRQLIAYLVSRHVLSLPDIKTYLGELLPAYMLPGLFVQVEALPLTPSGKIDRKRLPDPGNLGVIGDKEYVPPRNETEEKLSLIWKELLGRAPIGIKDDFFELGGHSLSATRLASQIHKVFEVDIPLRDLLSTSVLEEQARWIIQARKTSFIPIAPVAGQPHYALSSSQRRLWVLSQFEEGNIAYNMPSVYVFEGELDRDSLEFSFNALIERHEILRTVFGETEHGEIRQFVQPGGVGFRIDYQDLRSGGESGMAGKTPGGAIGLKDRVQEEFNKPFDLVAGPLIRSVLYQVEDNKWVLTFVMHHIISDGWSMGVLIRELLLLYNARVRQEEYELPPLPVQYKDYAAWQQAQLQGDAFKGHRRYWLNNFAGEIPVLELPGDKARPSIKTYNGGSVKRRIDPKVSKGIKELGRKGDSTLFMSLLAAVNTLLYRYTGQEDIIIGSPIAGRRHVDLEDQIGFFINTLALRIQFNGEKSYNQLLEHVRQLTLQAYEHQDYPFDELVSALGIQKDMSRGVLFDVMVALQNAAEDKIKGGQVEKVRVREYEEAENMHCMADLVFNFTDTADGILVNIGYNSDIYYRSTVERLADHFAQLLEEIITHSDVPISRLAVIDEAGRRKLLTAFNDTAVAFPAEKTIVHLFEEQVARTPDSIALVFEENVFTYRELNEQSNRLGNYLRQRYHINADDLVGIKLERSDRLIIAILGVLKSGGAYVPIDPDYPQERIDYVITDCQCKVMIDEQELKAFATEGMRHSIENPASVNQPGDLAYVMYTSGSTGQPKGVMVEHTAVVRLVKSTEYVALTGGETLLSTGAISFDATTFEYWGMLLNGGRLVMCRQEVLLDARQLAEEIETKKVDTMWFTTGWLNQLIDDQIAIFKGLKTILMGGDRLSPVHVNLLRHQYPALTIIHAYGPTENTTFSLTFPIETAFPETPIGRPISNSTVYLFDNRMELTPIGAIGEIYVGGAGLARGYLNQPALTSEKFLPGPFGIGGRIYKTGDLGKWLPDGNVVFAGRKDDQVKIRGFRIEPGEIESILKSHPDIDSAIVIVRPNADGEKELIAYIVSGQALQIADLRAFLGKVLPVYMIPVHYVQLEALPLTPNGKVDRKGLPDPYEAGMPVGVTFIAPRDPVEERLALIWKDVLGKEKISVKDNFFDSGGHSLNATYLTGQVHREFEVKIPIKQLFTHPVLEDLAQLIRQTQKTSFATIPRVKEQACYPLSSSQRLFWISCQFEESNIAYNMPAALLLEGELALPSLEYALTGLFERHESLRTIFKEDERGEIKQYIYTPEQVDRGIGYQDLRRESNWEEKLKNTVQEEFVKPFDLASGPLVRVNLFQTGDKEWVLTYVMHHIIGDGWSMEILIKELLLLYNAHVRGEAYPLTPLRIQYKDYTAWQQEQLKGAFLREHRSFWESQLEGDLPVLDLPIAKARPAIKTYAGGVIRRSISSGTSHAFKAMIHEQGATLFMGLLAAVNTLLYKYSDQTDIITGTSIAGREHIDLENQIGYYLNTLALRVQLEGQHSYLALLETVKRVTLGAYEHQVYPFEELVDALQLKRDPSRNNLFDVFVVMRNINVTNQHKRKEGLSGMIVSEYKDAEQQVSKFDLTFGFFEVGSELFLDLEYNSDLYDRAMASRITDDLEKIMHAVVGQPLAAIRELDLPLPVEKKRSMIGFNDKVESLFNSPISTEF